MANCENSVQLEILDITIAAIERRSTHPAASKVDMLKDLRGRLQVELTESDEASVMCEWRHILKTDPEISTETRLALAEYTVEYVRSACAELQEIKRTRPFTPEEVRFGTCELTRLLRSVEEMLD